MLGKGRVGRNLQQEQDENGKALRLVILISQQLHRWRRQVCFFGTTDMTVGSIDGRSSGVWQGGIR